MRSAAPRFLSRSLSPLLVLVLAGVCFAQDADPQGDENAMPVPARELVNMAGDPTEIPSERILFHLPEPDNDRARILERLQELRDAGTAGDVRYLERVLTLVESINRPRKLHLSLDETLRRVLESNYSIDIVRYNPAIEATRVVEAESAFDAVLFANATRNNIDQPSGSQLAATDIDTSSVTAGIRKLLPTGLQVSAEYRLDRTRTNLSFQQINPEYVTDFVLSLRQPLLRGFGVDFNRSLILIAQNEQRRSDWAFRIQLRDTLRRAEEAYWRVVQARRDVVISARLLVDFEQILEYLDARKDFDVIPVQLNATRANLEQSRADFIRRVAAVFDAEDALIALMNSDDVDLADSIEIVPTDFPVIEPVVLDRLTEIRTALEFRPELHQQRLAVKNAKLSELRTGNLELPRLDLTYSQTTEGLDKNSSASFSEATTSNFISYSMGIEFEIPIGNRGPRAATQRARLQHKQSMSALRQALEEVTLDVTTTVRALEVAYDQIRPSYESSEARLREVDSIVARAERKDLNTLNSELAARQNLAASRRAMLNAMVEYNIAIIDLERAKGTLLNYNNVLLTDGLSVSPDDGG